MANNNLLGQPLAQALTDNHSDIHQWHLLHQECLLLGLNDQALKSFNAFDAVLRLHIQFENEFLLYQSDGVASDQLQFQLRVYQKEHDKILQLLQQLQGDVNDYLAAKGRVQRLLLLDLLEKHFRLAAVLEHHEQREEQDLFLHIKALSLQAQWQALYQPLAYELETLKQQLKQQLQSA